MDSQEIRAAAQDELTQEFRRERIEQEKERLRKKRGSLFHRITHALKHKRITIRLEERP